MGNPDKKNVFELLSLGSNTMHYVTNKYTLKKDAVVLTEMLVPVYQPTKLSYALSSPQAYKQEAGQTKHRNVL